ncbi:PP2C family serine/threonine-protein phosphatase [Oceanicoccus sp. KOV_DT_Chl]|uniref:PP2C family protein-serine/threonine phosphatase n=1 Tax=Oceanicoccus sp. KOV_DT_Chl TaxID=1904639 RepID=UPI001358EF1D|nr:protein phosphatase 2C domain-containing protein [Oceanicoccus sp. KOV_DT_Chl]
MISIIGATHPGQREHNEDCFAVDTASGLGVVADGMGGYACGEVASELVKVTIERATAKGEDLVAAITQAHSAVTAAAAADESKAGMGSTAVAVKFSGLDYHVAWVGDSRAYLWDGESELKQISRDHSYVESLLSNGAISYEEAINHPNRNLITQAVGVAAEGGLDVGSVRGRLAAGQQLILCSDGLVDEVLDHDIAKLLAAAEDPEEALNALIRAAVVAGGHDNITVVIVTVPANEASGPAIEPEIVRLTFRQPRRTSDAYSATTSAKC